MFISRNLTYIFLGRVFFCPFLEHDPKPFPFGCACPTEGYFLMGPRQRWAVAGAGQGGAGSAIFAQEPPSPHLADLVVPIFTSSQAARHRRRCSLRPRRLEEGLGGWLATCLASRSHVDAHHPVSSLQARTGGEIGGILPSAPLPTFTCFAI